jgi:hypothetical protein
MRLVPSQPLEKDEGKEYMRRIPWRWIILGALAFAALAAVYQYKERQKADALRVQILEAHTFKLKHVSKKYQVLRAKIEQLVIKAASSKPDNFADSRLTLDKLRKAKGLYLRLRYSDAISPEKIASGAVATGVDSVAQCLGLEPGSVQELYEKGAFLMPDWDKIEEARKSNNVMRLRVIDDELGLRIRRDLLGVEKLLDPDWLMVVLQQGKARKKSLVDVFIWDLHRAQSLLRARLQADGTLVPVAFKAEETPPAPIVRMSDKFKETQKEAAGDCSIAAQIKAMTGEKHASFASEAPELDERAEATAAASGEAKKGEVTADAGTNTGAEAETAP